MNTQLFSINGDMNNSNVPESEFKPFKLEVLDQPDSELGKHYKKALDGGPPANEQYTEHFDSFSAQDPLLGEYSADNISALERRRAVLALQNPSNIPGAIHFVNLKEHPNDPDPTSEVAIYRPLVEGQLSEGLQKNLNFSTIVGAMNPRSSEPLVVVSKRVGDQSKAALNEAISFNLVTVAEDKENHQFRSILDTDVSGLPGGVAKKESVENELKAILNKSFNRDSRLPAGYKSTIEGKNFVVSKIDGNTNAGRLVFEMEQVSASGNLLPPLKGVALEYQGVAHKVDMDRVDQLQTVMGFIRPSKTIRKHANVGVSNPPASATAASSPTTASATSSVSNASRPPAASNGASGPANSSRTPASNTSSASTNGTASSAASSTSANTKQNGTSFNSVSGTSNGRQNGGTENFGHNQNGGPTENGDSKANRVPNTQYNPRVTVDSTATVIVEPVVSEEQPKAEPVIVNTAPPIMEPKPAAESNIEKESGKTWFKYHPETKTVELENFRAFNIFMLETLPETSVVRAEILRIVKLSEEPSNGQSDFEVISTAVLTSKELTDSDKLKVLTRLNEQRLSVLEQIKTPNN